jgi:outer membrane protein OmpA-like peptidoglycan-associated protein
MTPCARILALLLLGGSMLATAPASAQTVDSGSLVESLTPKTQKTRSLTRSLKPQPSGPNAEDAEFLKTLPTRGIRIEQRKKLDEIVKQQDLPRVDIEINFDFSSAEITPASIPDVNELGKALSSEALSGYRIVLNGHTDAVGGDAFNQELSERRAASVRQYLIEVFKIAPDRLIAIGYGEERLKSPSVPDAAENRRVEIINLTQG